MAKRTANHPVIAGDGIAGAAMALALARCGHEVLMVGDGAGDEPGGVQLAPNGWAALKTLGIDEELKPHAMQLTSLRLVTLESAITLSTIRLVRRPYTGMARKALRDVLMDAAGGSITRIKTRITKIDSRKDGVAIKLANGESITAPWLIGCDGAPGTGADGISREFVEAGGGRAPLHTRTALRAHIKDTGINVGGRSTTVWLDKTDGGHIVHYPLGDNSINLVAVVRTGGDANAKALAMLARQPLLAGFTDAIKAARPMPLYDYAPLDTWQRGRVILGGDAAHPMPPHLAQGAGQSLVDAASLMRHLQGSNDLQQVFTAWSAARVRELRDITGHAKRAGRVFGLRGMGARVRDMGLGAGGDVMLGRVLDEVWRE